MVMGGLGYKTETYMPLPADIGLNMTIADYTMAWINSCDLLIDKCNQNLHTTPFVIAGGIPFNDPGSICCHHNHNQSWFTLPAVWNHAVGV